MFIKARRIICLLWEIWCQGSCAQPPGDLFQLDTHQNYINKLVWLQLPEHWRTWRCTQKINKYCNQLKIFQWLGLGWHRRTIHIVILTMMVRSDTQTLSTEYWSIFFEQITDCWLSLYWSSSITLQTLNHQPPTPKYLIYYFFSCRLETLWIKEIFWINNYKGGRKILLVCPC